MRRSIAHWIVVVVLAFSCIPARGETDVETAFSAEVPDAEYAVDCIVGLYCVDPPEFSEDPTDTQEATAEVMPAVGAGLLMPGDGSDEGDCGSGSGLVFRGTILPYGNGWSDTHGDSIYHVIHVCESAQTDSAGYRYVFWRVYQSLNAGNGWHARHDRPESKHTAWYEPAAGDGDVIVQITPLNFDTSGCSTERFSLSAMSVSMSWDENLCSIREQKDTWTGALVKWWSQVRYTVRSPTFVYGLVTRTQAGATSSLAVHHLERFCRDYTSCGQQVRFDGNYVLGVPTTPAVHSVVGSPLICGDVGYSGSEGAHVYWTSNGIGAFAEDPCPATGTTFSGELGFAVGGAWLFSRTGPDTNGLGSGATICYGSPADSHHGWDEVIHVQDDLLAGHVGFQVLGDYNRTTGNTGFTGLAQNTGPGNSGGAADCGDGLIEPCPDGVNDSNATVSGSDPVGGCNHLDARYTMLPELADENTFSLWGMRLGDFAGADGSVMIILDPRASSGRIWTSQ